MKRATWIISFGICFSLLMSPSSAFAAKNLQIVSVQYDQHAHPNEAISFSIVVRNKEATAESAEVDITISNVDTEAETTLTPVLTTSTNIPAGQTAALRGSYVIGNLAGSGTFTVSFPLFDGNGLRSDRLQGKYPIHIGTETESIRVFPEAINLGTLPPGRTMYPTPIEVSWSYFRFNRLRLDQPFVVRIYTDNAARYHGVPGAVRRGSPGGLVSLNGKYAVPLKVWCLNFGPDLQEVGWDSALAGPPPVDDDNSWLGPPLIEGSRHYGGASWVRIKDRVELGVSPFGWSRGEGLIGQDPHDNRYANEKNPTGDITLKSPFTLYVATETGPNAVRGSYSGTLIVEIWSP